MIINVTNMLYALS